MTHHRLNPSPFLEGSIVFVFVLFAMSIAFSEDSESRLRLTSHPIPNPHRSDETDAVDLSGETVPFQTRQAESSPHILARPWYDNIDISGFGAVWFVDSGADGTRPNPGFVIKEATLFVEAQAWEDVSFFFELQTNPLQRDHSGSVRTAEIYAHFRNVLKKWGDNLLGIKAGRIDIPFGEEYLWQDAPDNPLISNSAAYPWLWDEGISLYGSLGGLDWIVALTDGTFQRSIEDNPAKAVTAKVSATPLKSLDLSASFMKNGAAATGALLLGGSRFEPIGTGDEPEGASSVGASPSSEVDAILYELGLRLKFMEKANLEVAFGRAFIDDQDDFFDRTLTWFSVQGIYNLTTKIYAVARYSEIGTYDSDKGYQIGGEFLAGGDDAFGYDAKRLQRLSIGLGWKLTPRTTLKLEVGGDRFEVIGISPFDPTDDERNALGFELAQSF